MVITHRFDTSFQLDGRVHHAVTRIEEVSEAVGVRYRAVIETPPLRGTYGGEAENIDLALDMLNLAMQAEGADEISFVSMRQEAG